MAAAEGRRRSGRRRGPRPRTSPWRRSRRVPTRPPSSSRAKPGSIPPRDSAELSVAIESGPPFRIGAIDIQGLKRYTPELVRNFANVHAGDLYGERPLDDYVRRLLGVGLFRERAGVDRHRRRAGRSRDRSRCRVIEAPTKRLEFGVGYSTDTQWKASGNYSDVNIDGHGLQIYAERADRNEGPAGRPALRAAADRRRLARHLRDRARSAPTSRTSSRARPPSRARRRAIDERSTPAFGIGFYVERADAAGAPTESSHALYVDGEYTWRNVDDLLAADAGLHGQRAGRRGRARARRPSSSAA